MGKTQDREARVVWSEKNIVNKWVAFWSPYEYEEWRQKGRKWGTQPQKRDVHKRMQEQGFSTNRITDRRKVDLTVTETMPASDRSVHWSILGGTCDELYGKLATRSRCEQSGNSAGTDDVTALTTDLAI